MALRAVIGADGRDTRVVADALSYVAPEREWLVEWRALNLSCVHVTLGIWEDAKEALTAIGNWRRLIRENSDIVALARSAADVRRIVHSNKTAVVWGFQNSAPIQHEIDFIETFRELGILVMQLTYNLQNYVGCGYWEEVDTGLSSRFGRLVVSEMNRVGMLIDLSHCGDRTTLEATEASARPVALTHTNPREYVGSPPFGAGRLAATEALKLVASGQGFVGLSPLFSISRRSETNTVDEFAEMVAWTADLIGTTAIGIGSDYCPGHPPDIVTWWRYARWSRETATFDPTKSESDDFPGWFVRPDRFSILEEALRRHGFDDLEVRGLLGENFLRVLEAATGTVGG